MNMINPKNVQQDNYTTPKENRKFYTPEEVRQLIFANTDTGPSVVG